MNILDKNGCGCGVISDVYCFRCSHNKDMGRMKYTGERSRNSRKYNGNGYWFKCVDCSYKMDYDKDYAHTWRIKYAKR